MKLHELVRDILDATDYILEMDVDTEEEAQARIDNIEEFINKAINFEQNHRQR